MKFKKMLNSFCSYICQIWCFRYLTANINMSTGWRKSVDYVPICLQHRPLHLLQHMREVEQKAASIPATAITRLDDISFLATTGSRLYPVCLGNDSTMPSCECRAFRRTHMPCKHFSAIFRHFADVSFASLAKPYIDNPVFVVDDDLFNKDDLFQQETLLEATDNKVKIDEIADAEERETVPKKGFTKLNVSGKLVRESLSTIHSLSFLVDSVDVLRGVRDQLGQIINTMQKSCPKSGGIVLEAPERYGKAILNPLPKPKKRKQREQKKGNTIFVI